jgi:hypothetical protein
MIFEPLACSAARMTRLAIGIPTRNRAELTMAAVESVLAADMADVAVIVSDNSTDEAEQSRLSDFCAGRSAQIEYVRPPTPLEMAAHWEWLRKLVVKQAAPTHVAYLTDRLVFTRGALGDLVRIVDRHPDKVVSYHHDHLEDAAAPVELVQTQWTGGLLELDARKLIELSSRGLWGDHLPRMLNCVVPVSALEAIEQRFGSVFAPVAPDYRFAYRCLATCETFLYFDRACMIEQGMGRSAGNSFAKGRFNRDAASFKDELSVPRFGATHEERFETIANSIFQEYLAVRAEAGGERFPPVERGPYLLANALSVERIEEPEWRERMEDVLSEHGWTRRHRARHALEQALAIAGYFARHPGALAPSIRRQLWDRPPGTPLARLLTRAGLNPRVREHLTFASSADAIAHADAHPRPRMPYAWHVHRLERAGAIARRLPPP